MAIEPKEMRVLTYYPEGNEHIICVVVFNDGTKWYTDASNTCIIRGSSESGIVYGFRDLLSPEDIPNYQEYEDGAEKALTVDSTVPEITIDPDSVESHEIQRIYQDHM